jgi:hypothetical protein
LLRETGLRWYGDDSDCPAWGEPSGDDFQSSALIEAECMRRLLPPEGVLAVVRSVPATADRKEASNAVPAHDGHRPHGWQDRTSRRTQSQPGLVLALTRQCLAGKRRSACPCPRDRRKSSDRRSSHIAGDYMGEHWLASFAVLALGDED